MEWLESPAGRVPRISSELTFYDHYGACKARWGIGRMEFMVPPGLYAIGTPDANSQVVVTANYKMTYDIVRREMAGADVWLLVLETYGINVWCAAGKGTFGTDEVVHRVQSSRLAQVVSHRCLVLPILGAPGVAAHEVARRCGFSVRYATISAADLPEYLGNGMVTTPDMRKVAFSWYDRLVLIPVEVVQGLKTLMVTSVIVLLGCALGGGFSAGLAAFGGYLGAALCGIILGPLLLPWLPSRSFEVKGAAVGLLWAVVYYRLAGHSWPLLPSVASFLILPTVSAYHTLNFTGCTTYTSRSGVKKEMRIGFPVMGAALVAGLVLLVVGRFMR